MDIINKTFVPDMLDGYINNKVSEIDYLMDLLDCGATVVVNPQRFIELGERQVTFPVRVVSL